MRKVLLFTIIFFIIILNVGCSNLKEVKKTSQETNNVNSETASQESSMDVDETASHETSTNINEVVSKESNKIKAETFKIYEESFLAENLEVDLDGDGEQEIVKMYIHPGPIEDVENKGQYFWDDSHFWQLIVFDGDKTYPLFNNNLNGKLKFWIEGNEEQKTIILLIDGGVLALQTFQYDNEGFFNRVEHYQSTENNIARSSKISL